MNDDKGDYEEKDVSAFLPRNLSYAGDSSLDEFSISSSFVHTPRYSQRDSIRYMHLLKAMAKEGITIDSLFTEHGSAGSSVDPINGSSTFCDTVTDSQNSQTESDTPSEEGIYVNMLDDDLEQLSPRANGNLQTLDEGIDSTCSPEGSDLDVSIQGHKERLEEAVMHISDTDLKEIPALTIMVTDNSTLLQSSTEDAILNYSSSKSHIDDENEFNFPRGELRKTSSLRVNKTPPGTPSRKKVVRFADAMGLDLESVRNIVNMESPPQVPASALADLKLGLAEDRLSMGCRHLSACFQQPGAAVDFMNKVITNKVCLENAVVTNLTVTGVVRVVNVSLSKMVRVRYSPNSWESYHDIIASHVHDSCDGPTDRFSFSIVAPANFDVGSKLEFAVSYSTNSNVYWDNNDNANYIFECFAKTVPTEAENSWMHFL